MSAKGVARRLLAITLCSLFLVLHGCCGAYAEEPAKAHKDCATCHKDDKEKATVRKRINETCRACHPGSTDRDHRVGIVSKGTPVSLPLGEGEIITCATCHDPHGKTKEQALLRMGFNDLCRSCHKK